MRKGIMYVQSAARLGGGTGTRMFCGYYIFCFVCYPVFLCLAFVYSAVSVWLVYCSDRTTINNPITRLHSVLTIICVVMSVYLCVSVSVSVCVCVCVCHA